MTASTRLEYSACVQQSLSELTYRACQIGEQVQSLEKQVTFQILHLTQQLDKERKHPRKFLPLCDREKFYQWNEQYLSKFNKTLCKLFLEIRLYEEKLHNYQATIHRITSEVAHG